MAELRIALLSVLIYPPLTGPSSSVLSSVKSASECRAILGSSIDLSVYGGVAWLLLWLLLLLDITSMASILSIAMAASVASCICICMQRGISGFVSECCTWNSYTQTLSLSRFGVATYLLQVQWLEYTLLGCVSQTTVQHVDSHSTCISLFLVHLLQSC
jgi:hypothetical protein